MNYYVRKINLSKYPKPPIIKYDKDSLKADAVSDISTKKDELSIWKINSNNDKDIDEGILAIITQPKQISFDTIDVVVFSEEDLKNKNLKIENEKGLTAVSDLIEEHYNIVELTYNSLYSVLQIISDITLQEGHVRRTRTQLEQLIKKNYTRINLDVFLEESVKNKIKDISKK